MLETRSPALRLLPWLLVALLALAGALATRPDPVRAVGGSWPTYHLDNARDGNDTSESTFTSEVGRWSVTGLDGSVYASPLVFGGKVFLVTENDSAYAFDEVTGSQLWYRHLATPVAASRLACGNIDPVGITGTPVIDTTSGVLYAAGLVSTSATTMQDQLFALKTADGTDAAAARSIDPAANLDPREQGQRAALALAGGNVYVPFGGRAGDCQPYHPWVIGVPENGGAIFTYQPQNPATQGEAGIWGPSGPAVDGSGNVYVATGNGAYGSSTPCNNANWDHGNAVIKLSSALAELSSFAPTNWCALSASDTDVGSLGPSLLANGEVFQAGKSGDGWLLNGSALGGFGGQQFTAHVDSCPTSDAIFGGTAYDGTRIFVPCDTNGLVAENVTTTGSPSFGVAWTSAGQGGVSYNAGAPIVAGGVVWSLDQSGGNLYGFDETTGARKFTIAVGSHTRFATPAAADGYIFVPTQTGVTALQFASFTPSYTAYFTWYDHASSPGFTSDDLHLLNPGTGSVQVAVSIPGSPGCAYPNQAIAAGAELVLSCSKGFGGPVAVLASGRVIASQRTTFFQSFNEVLAQPVTAASTAIDFSWYDHVSNPGFAAGSDNIHVLDPGGSASNVTVTIPGCGAQSQTVPSLQERIFSCANGFGGPVLVRSTNGVPVLAGQRVQYYQTFNEVDGQDANSPSTDLRFSWYDHASSPGFLSDNVHVVNPSAGAADVTVTIPGCSAQPGVIAPGAYQIFSCPSGYGGPVTVTSTNAVGILASQRVQFYQSFNEVGAMPVAAAAATIYFSWYDHVSSSTFAAGSDVVHVTNPSGSTATVTVTIPGCGASAPTPVAPGGYGLFGCATGFGGPVLVSSTSAGVLASQRVEYGQTFNEVTGAS